MEFYTDIFYIGDGKAEFSVSLLQFSVSHDPPEIILKMLICCLRIIYY